MTRGRRFCVQIQSPHLDRRRFDLIVVSEHDWLRGENAVPTGGALHRVTAARLAAASRFEPPLASLPRPLVAVLVSGSNRDCAMDAAWARRFGKRLAAHSRATGSGSPL